MQESPSSDGAMDVIIKGDPDVISPFTGKPYPKQCLNQRIFHFRRLMLQRYPDHFTQTFNFFGLDIEAIQRVPSVPREVEVPSTLTTPIEIASLSPIDINPPSNPEDENNRHQQTNERRRSTYPPYYNRRRTRSHSRSPPHSAQPSSSGHRMYQSSRRRGRYSPPHRQRTSSPHSSALSNYITRVPPANAIKNPTMEEVSKLTIQINNFPLSLSLPKLASIFAECGPIRDVQQVNMTNRLRFNTAYIQFWLPEAIHNASQVAGYHRLNITIPDELLALNSPSPKSVNAATKAASELLNFDVVHVDEDVPQNATECLFLSDFFTSTLSTDSADDYAVLARESLLFTVQQALQDDHGIVHLYPFRHHSLLGKISVKCLSVNHANVLQKYLTNVGHTVTFVAVADYARAFPELKAVVQSVSPNYGTFRDKKMSRKTFFVLEEGLRHKRTDQYLDFMAEMQVCEMLARSGKGETRESAHSGGSVASTPVKKVESSGITIKLACMAPEKEITQIPLDVQTEELMQVDSGTSLMASTVPSENVISVTEECESVQVVTSMVSSDNVEEQMEVVAVESIVEPMITDPVEDIDSQSLIDTAVVEKEKIVEENVKDVMDEMNTDLVNDVSNNEQVNPTETVESEAVETIEVAETAQVELPNSVNIVATPTKRLSNNFDALNLCKTAPNLGIDNKVESVLVTPQSKNHNNQQSELKSSQRSTVKKSSSSTHGDKLTRSLMRAVPNIMPSFEVDNILNRLTELEALLPSTSFASEAPSTPTLETLHRFSWQTVVDETVNKAVNNDGLWNPFYRMLEKEEALLLAADDNYANELAEKLASTRGDR